MKKFISRVKNLSHRAAELRAAMEKAPATIAEIRETVAATTGQLQQLRTQVQSSVVDLKAESDDRISHALQEINSSMDVFLQAGFEVGGVDLDISPIQGLRVHFHKLEDVDPSVIKQLIAANQSRKTTHALLSSLLQAQQLAEQVELTNLHYDQLIVGVGRVPSVRLCWRGEEVFHAEEVAEPVAELSAPTPTLARASHSYYGQGSFFERHSSGPAPSHSTLPAQPSAAAPHVESAHSPAAHEDPHAQSGTGDWKQAALDRLKKTPHASKYYR